MRSSPSTKTRTPATGSPSASVTVPLTTFGRSSMTRSPSSGTAPSAASWPSAEADTVAPRSAVRVAAPSASVRTVVPSTSRAAASTGVSVPRVTTLTATSRGCSGVGSGVGTNGRSSPHAASTRGRARTRSPSQSERRGSRVRSFRRADRSRVRVVPGRRPAGRRPWAPGRRRYCTGRCRPRARLPRSRRPRRSCRDSRPRRRRSAARAPVGRPRRAGLAASERHRGGTPARPTPGWTVMTSSRSTWSSHGRTASAGVSGLRAIPGRLPARSISAITARGSSSASTWKTIRSLPACAKRSA